MNVSRKPAVHTGISLLVTALSMTLAAPVLATPTTAARTTVTASKPVSGRAKVPKPQLAIKTPAAPEARIGQPVTETPASAVMATRPLIDLSVSAPSQGQPSAAVVAMPVAVSVAIPTPAVTAAVPAAPATVPVAASAALPVASASPATQSVNPYLAGWYRPVPAVPPVALPAMAMGQLNYSARYVTDSVTSLPGKLADALPSIKTVHPTGGRDLVVANLRCPAEMVTGQYMLPANAMREGVNGLFSKLNETQLLKFDIQLVCS